MILHPCDILNLVTNGKWRGAHFSRLKRFLVLVFLPQCVSVTWWHTELSGSIEAPWSWQQRPGLAFWHRRAMSGLPSLLRKPTAMMTHQSPSRAAAHTARIHFTYFKFAQTHIFYTISWAAMLNPLTYSTLINSPPVCHSFYHPQLCFFFLSPH